MADRRGDGKAADSSEVKEINIDELISKNEEDASTEVCGSEVKGLDANRYATKKTVAQGMLDIALLTSNASQLKYVLQVGPKHEFYTLLVTLISVSMVLQVAMGLVLLSLNLLRDCRFHLPRHRTSALNINYMTTAAAFLVTVLNVLVATFDSSLARYMELELLVGLLFVAIGGLDLNNQADQPSALVLNDVIVIFIFVISITNIVISAFGIEYSNSPLILERLKYINNEYLRKSNVISTVVALILSIILNINNIHHQRGAEILNNTTLVFKSISIPINILITVFTVQNYDNIPI